MGSKLWRGCICGGAVLLLGLMGDSAVLAQEETEYEPIAPKNPTIRVKELEILVQPLTKEELFIEAEAWKQLIKDKVHQIANADVAVQLENVRKDIQEEKKAQAGESDELAVPPAEPDEEIAGATEERAEEARQLLEQQEAEEAEAALAEEAPAGETPAEEEEPTDKARFLEQLNKLREERIALNDRAAIVLAELKRKGGDPTEIQNYLTAVGRTRVDTEDIERLWATVRGWLLSSEGGLRMGKNFLWFVGTLLAFLVVSRIAGKATEKGLGRTRGVTHLMRAFVVKSVRRAVLVVGLIVALAQLEVDIGPLLALIGAAGFVVAFALQDTLGNFASGIMILVYRPFDVGDVVDVAGVSGTVESLNLVSVAIKTFDNKSVVVPNNEVWGNVITNATASHTRRVDLVFGIGYGDDMAKAQSILERIVAAHEDTLENPAPVIKVHELADSSVNFICRPWVKTDNYWKVYWDITRSVKEQFDAEGVSIPFPQRDVHLYKTAE